MKYNKNLLKNSCVHKRATLRDALTKKNKDGDSSKLFSQELSLLELSATFSVLEQVIEFSK